MIRVAYIQFINHPVLGDLKLDFSALNGNPVDTVIFAGENGVGKSNAINAIYECLSGTAKHNYVIGIEREGTVHNISFEKEKNSNFYNVIDTTDGYRTIQTVSDFKKHFNFGAIFSDVDINFHSEPISSVTSLTLDSDRNSRKSNSNLPKQVKQLLIDIQAMDDAVVASAVREDRTTTYDNLKIEERMPRFTKAFNYMFADSHLKYDHVENKDNSKAVLFKKYGQSVALDDLSSGEKQIVFRGCFLLKDVNALNGAVVFIDEPEISLHPNWQKKILDYYKNIFTDSNGTQTSQLFVVTHSPFIIHNENRRNDKVLVLGRDENGDVTVQDKPEYYYCSSTKAIEDAFSIKDFSESEACVFLEGRTDAKYFNKMLEVYDMIVPFKFKWIGYIDDKGQESNTGKDSLNKAYQFLVGRNLNVKNVCLKDCDTNAKSENKNNAYKRSIPYYDNSKGFKIGIENALQLDGIDTNPFYKTKESVSDYGEHKSNQQFQKMEFCNYICNLDKEKLQHVFKHLKEVADDIVKIYKEGISV